MPPDTDLSSVYRDYIACLNQQDWRKLGHFVDADAIHNGRRLGLSGYRQMLEKDFADIPDLYFDVRMLIAEPPYVASRIAFDCAPKGVFLGLAVNGRRVSFAENVIYQFRRGKIVEVWSVVDKTAIEAQLGKRLIAGRTSTAISSPGNRTPQVVEIPKPRCSDL